MRVLRGCIAAVICLVAHGLLLTTILWSAGTPAPPTDDLPPTVHVTSDSSEEAMQWIVLDPQALSDPSKERPELPPVHLQTFDTRKVLTEAAVLIQDLDLPRTPEATVADAGRLSQLYGRYMGQISARIDRAWLRPRTPVGGDSFSCRARILQDAVGNVLEVTLEQCNGDPRWQLSLVQAIDSASPLPAPPDANVFSRTVHLGFTAEGYSAGRHEEQYEPEMLSRAAQQNVISQLDGDALNRAFSDPHPDGIIRLSIVGTHRTNDAQGTPDEASPPRTDPPATEDSPR
jgi:hypothetical protein